MPTDAAQAAVAVTSQLEANVIEALVRRYRALGAEKATIETEMAAIKARVDEVTPLGWKMPIDGLTASKRAPNRSFDTLLAIGFLDDTEKAACKVTQYDPKKIRAFVVAKGKLDDCMRDDLEALPVVKLS